MSRYALNSGSMPCAVTADLNRHLSDCDEAEAIGEHLDQMNADSREQCRAEAIRDADLMLWIAYYLWTEGGPVEAQLQAHVDDNAKVYDMADAREAMRRDRDEARWEARQ